MTENGVDDAARFSDSAYGKAGVDVVGGAAVLYAISDNIARVRAPSLDEVAAMPDGKKLIIFFTPQGIRNCSGRSRIKTSPLWEWILCLASAALKRSMRCLPWPISLVIATPKLPKS